MAPIHYYILDIRDFTGVSSVQRSDVARAFQLCIGAPPYLTRQGLNVLIGQHFPKRDFIVVEIIEEISGETNIEVSCVLNWNKDKK